MFKFDESKHGLRVSATGNPNVTRASITSLRIALISFFETYHASRVSLNISQLDDPSMKEMEDNVAHYSLYQQKYLQTVFHFHHFFELLTKDVLRTVDPFYAVKIDTKDLKVLKAIRNGDIVEDSVHSVEFETAVSRMCSLRGEADAPPLSNIYTPDVKKHSLEILNRLRNRAWHRGLFVLRYSELDRFIVQNILPLAIEALDNSHYKGMDGWKYKQSTKLPFDPIEQLIFEGQRAKFDYSRVAFFKAVGLACYKRNSFGRRLRGYNKRAYSEDEADKLVDGGIEGADEVRECFVCGKQSLVLYRNDDADVDENNNILEAWWNIYKAECQECNLLLYDDVDNPKAFGINQGVMWRGETTIARTDE